MIRVFFGALWAVLVLVACADSERGSMADYRALEVPAERLASASAQARGRSAYLRYCALCHGENADGHGVRRDSLSGPPQDFTQPQWRQRMTPKTVYVTIREGRPGTSMASWKALDSDTTWDLVAYLMSVAGTSSRSTEES